MERFLKKNLPPGLKTFLVTTIKFVPLRSGKIGFAASLSGIGTG